MNEKKNLNSISFKILSRWLSYFGEPAFRLLQDNKKTSKISTNIKMKLEDIIKTNYNKEGFGAFFTPNGDYGKGIKEGEKYNIKKNTSPTGLYYSLFVDIDDERKWDDIQNIIDTYYLPPTFVVKTGRGWHLYYVLETPHKFEEEVFKKAGEILADIYKADKSNLHIAKLMRLPLTYWYKKGKKLIELYVYKKRKGLTKIEEKFIEPDFLVKPENVYNFIKNYEEEKNAQKIEKEFKTQYTEYIKDISKIKIVDIINIIDKNNIYKIHGNKKYKFTLGKKIGTNTQQINIIYKTNEGEVYYQPDGYRINLFENYANNFSDQYHPITERPRGGPIPFLYYYFNKNWNDVFNFLQKYFNINITQYQKEEDEQIFDDGLGNMLIFSDNVYIQGTDIKGNVKNYTVFLGSYRIKGYINRRIKRMGAVVINELGEDKTEMFYILEEKNTKKQILIKYKESATKFNQEFGDDIRFLESTRLLNIFFNILDLNKDKLIEYEWIDESYIDFDRKLVFYPNTIFYKENDKLDTSNLLLRIPFEDVKKHIIMGQKEISINKALDKFKQLYTPHLAETGFLQFIALAGLNFWDSFGFLISSGLGIFGSTKTGKSTFVSVLKNLLGISFKRRTLQVNATKPQKLKEELSDNTILTLEEFTNIKDADTEDILRAAMNMGKVGRGYLNTNIEWTLKSPLIVLGENTPTEDSVENRLVAIYLYKDDQIGSEELLEDIKKYSIKKHLYHIFLNKREEARKISEELQELQKEFKNIFGSTIASRAKDAYAKAYIMGRLIGLKQKHLINIFSKTLERTYTGGIISGFETNDTHKIKGFLSGAAIKKQMMYNKIYYNNGILHEFHVIAEYALKYKFLLTVMKKLGFRIIPGDMVIITYFVPDTNMTTTDKAINMIFEDLQQILKPTVGEKEKDFIQLDI